MADKGETVTFTTIGGNTVTFVHDGDHSYGYGEMTCNGCKTSSRHIKVGEANQHSAECRAQ